MNNTNGFYLKKPNTQINYMATDFSNINFKVTLPIQYIYNKYQYLILSFIQALGQSLIVGSLYYIYLN